MSDHDGRKDEILGHLSLLGITADDSIEDAREDYLHGKIEVDEFERRIAAVIAAGADR